MFCLQRNKKQKKKVETFNFSALHLIHDPQSKSSYLPSTPYRFTVHHRISERHCTSERTHFWGKKCELVVSILHVFVLSVLFLCHSFQLITLVHVLVSSYGRQSAIDVRGSIREAFVLDDSCKTA